MNSNASFNSDGMENQNNSQDPLHQNNNNFIPHQYFSHMPSQLHPIQQQQQQQYVQAQQYVPIYGHPQYQAPHLTDPIQVLKNQQSFGGMDTQSFVKTMEYKKEQEISKQYSYKLEMLRLSMQANIPGNMIPQLFSNDSNIFKNNSLALASPEIQDEGNYSKSLPHPNSDVVLIDPHKQIRLQTVGTASISDYDEDTNSESSLANGSNLMPPSFKRQHKRTNSPSRIGGLGVKALNKIVSVNESQENSKNNSRISSMNSIQNEMEKPTLFKPSIRSFTNSNKGSVLPSAQNSRVSSIRVNSDQNKNIQSPSNNNNPPVGSFKPQHKRFNSLPTVLKPSPFLSSFKQTNNSELSTVDNQTSETLLQLSQERYSRLSDASKHSRKRSYDFNNTSNREQIDLNFINSQDAANMEYVVNKKFKFGTDLKHQAGFPNTSPYTDVEYNSNSQSRTVSDCSVTGNTNQAANKFLSTQAETADTKSNNQGDGDIDHDTTIEEEEDINNTSNKEAESTDKKVQFVEPQQHQQHEAQQSAFVQRHKNTLESILN